MALLSTLLSALIRKGIVVGLAILLLFGLVEAILWIAAPVSRYVTYHFHFENQVAAFGLKNQNDFDIDSRELRVRPAAEDREEEVTLLVIGGEGHYVPLKHANDTWWGQIASTLEKQHPEWGVRVEMKSGPASRPDIGTSMRYGLRWAKTYAGEIDPDIIVIAFGLSEVLDPPPNYQYNPTLMQTLKGLPRPGSLKDRAVSVSQIARRLRHWRSSSSETVADRKALLEQPNYLLKSMGLQRSAYEKFPFDVNPPRRDEGNDPLYEYLDGLKSFHSLAKRLGAELIILGEPALHDDVLGVREMIRLKRLRWLKWPNEADPQGSGLRPDPGWVEREMNRYFDAGADWAAKERIPFVDLNREEVLAKSTENFVDDATLTLLGSRRLADELTPVFGSSIKKILAK